MARKVFFSFHYDDVVSFRANVVRQHGFFKGNQEAGFWDNSIWEEAKKTGDTALKRMINGALDGTSVTCVLIGLDTYARPWVRYEILKSIERGNGVLGIHINRVKDKFQQTKSLGPNPFMYLYLQKGSSSDKLNAYEWNKEWVQYNKLPVVDYTGSRSFDGRVDSYFDVYDWSNDDGYNSFGEWVEKAAKEAGR